MRRKERESWKEEMRGEIPERGDGEEKRGVQQLA
jgi:hypothetical protein